MPTLQPTAAGAATVPPYRIPGDPLSPADQAAGAAEGWEVVRETADGITQVQLRRAKAVPGVEPRFTSDGDVWSYAVRMARAGSEFYRGVLNAVDDTERMLIEAACGSWQLPVPRASHINPQEALP